MELQLLYSRLVSYVLQRAGHLGPRPSRPQIEPNPGAGLSYESVVGDTGRYFKRAGKARDIISAIAGIRLFCEGCMLHEPTPDLRGGGHGLIKTVRGIGAHTLALFLPVLTAFHLGSLWLHGHEGVHTGIGGLDAPKSTTIMAVDVMIVCAVLVRWLNRPLRGLALAADRLDRGSSVAISAEGPEEVRRLAAALEAIKARVDKLVQDRLKALAAALMLANCPEGGLYATLRLP